MTEFNTYILLAFATSFILGWYIIPRIVLISKRKRLFDKIDARKEAKPPTPRLGGLAFFPVSLFAFSLVLGIRYIVDDTLPATVDTTVLLTFMFLIAGTVMIFLVGLADDLVEIGYKTKFVAQFFSATLLVLAGLSIGDLQNILFFNTINPTAASVFTAFVIVFTINSFNLIDGVNGLCAGLSIVALSVLGCWYWYVGDVVYAVLAFSILGVLFSFIFYNVVGKRLLIFMGDTGSLILGYMIVFLALKFNSDTTIHESGLYEPINRLALIIGLIFVPIFDTLRVFITRLSKGHSPFRPDRTHIHHKLLNLGFTHNKTTLILIISQIGYIVLNILLSQVLKLDNNLTILIDILIALGLIYTIDNKNKKKITK